MYVPEVRCAHLRCGLDYTSLSTVPRGTVASRLLSAAVRVLLVPSSRWSLVTGKILWTESSRRPQHTYIVIVLDDPGPIKITISDIRFSIIEPAVCSSVASLRASWQHLPHNEVLPQRDLLIGIAYRFSVAFPTLSPRTTCGHVWVFTCVLRPSVGCVFSCSDSFLRDSLRG